MDDFYLYLYRSIHDVMRADSALKKSRIPAHLVPIPTSVRADCGMGVAVLPQIHQAAVDALQSADSEPVAIYRHEPSGELQPIEDG
jgi:hypothetical protein